MIHDLAELLDRMDPVLEDREYLFCSISVVERRSLDIEPIFEFIEAEGISIVLPRAEAESRGLRGEFLSRMIKLRVYSSLNAVGFLAALTTRLASHGISVQAVSAFHHDYLFVPAARAEEAVAVLRHTSCSTLAGE